MSKLNQPANTVGFCFFTISLDSQSYRSSTYKPWKVQESLNKQGEGGPGPRGLRLPWQASLPQHSAGEGKGRGEGGQGAAFPPLLLPVHWADVLVSCGLDLWAMEAAGLLQLGSRPCHSGFGTGVGFSVVTSVRIGLFPFPCYENQLLVWGPDGWSHHGPWEALSMWCLK